MTNLDGHLLIWECKYKINIMINSLLILKFGLKVVI